MYTQAHREGWLTYRMGHPYSTTLDGRDKGYMSSTPSPTRSAGVCMCFLFNHFPNLPSYIYTPVFTGTHIPTLPAQTTCSSSTHSHTQTHTHTHTHTHSLSHQLHCLAVHGGGEPNSKAPERSDVVHPDPSLALNIRSL